MRNKNDSRMELYDRAWLCDARFRMHLSQKEVADRCNISQGAYNLIERGLRTPNVKLGLTIIKVLEEGLRSKEEEIKEKEQREVKLGPSLWLTERRIA